MDVTEKRKVVLLSTNLPNDELPLLTKFSKFSKLQHVTALCLRFIQYCKTKTRRPVGNLSLQELQIASNTLIRTIQQQEFSNELKKLIGRQKKQVN